MIKVSIYKNSILVAQGRHLTLEIANDWINFHKNARSWGKPERTIRIYENGINNHDEILANAISSVGGSDSEGNYTDYSFASELVIQIEDITTQLQAEQTAKSTHETQKTNSKAFFQTAQAEIDAIANLNDAKVFLRRLTRNVWRFMKDVNDLND